MSGSHNGEMKIRPYGSSRWPMPTWPRHRSITGTQSDEFVPNRVEIWPPSADGYFG